MSYVDITDELSRLEAYEEQCGLRFDAISAWYDATDGDITVKGEVHSLDGNPLSGGRINLVIYDDRDRVVGISYAFISPEVGFQVFEVSCSPPVNLRPNKIRLYPEP